MMTRSDDPDARPEALRRLTDHQPGTPALEERVVRSLRSTGRLRGSTRLRKRLAWVTGLAAAVLAFVGGRMTGGVERAADDHSPQWMILLYEDDSFRPPPPGQEQTYVEEYGRWAATLAAEEHLVTAGELLPGGRLIEADGRVGPSADPSSLGVLSGYFLIRAGSLEQAQAIAATCPHLGHGGRLVIRPVGLS